jgi:hypothetical protein
MIKIGNPTRSRLLVTAALVAVVLTAATPAPRKFHGFCHCSGTFIPDCNTKADCLGAACLSAPTFC